MATYVVKARKTALKANFSASATQLTLNELLDSRGDPIVMASFGDWFALVIKQGSQVEIVKCDGLTQNGNGSATCDVATNGRNIAPIPPYTGSASGFTFLSGAEVIVTNDPLTMMYYLFNNENTWLQKQTFSVAPESAVNAVTANALIRKSQLDSAVLGVATSVSVVVEGIAGVTVADGDLIYFDTTADAWLKCDADTASTVNNVLLGIAQGSGTIGNLIANGVMLRGTDDAQTGMSAGDIMYASNTAGDISNVAGTTPVAVGIAKSATELYFEPRFNTSLSQNQVNALNGANNPSGSNVFLTANDASATPSANIIPKADANGTLNSFVTGINGVYQALENLTAGNAVSAYPIQSDGGIKIDTTTGSGSTISSSGSITVGANSNKLVLIFASSADNTTVPTVTVGGNSATQINGGNAPNMYAFYRLAPANGANAISFNTSCAWVAYSLYNVHQTTPIDTSSTTTNTGSAITTPATTVDGAMMFTAFGTGQDNTTPSLSGEVGYAGVIGASTSDGSAKLYVGSAGQVFPTRTSSGTTTTGGFSLRLIYVSIAPATSVTYTGVVKTYAGNNSTIALSQYANRWAQFLGFVTNSPTSGQNATVQHTGVVSGLSGLKPMTLYYLSDTTGAISDVAGTNSKKIGIALSATTLLIKHDN